MKSQKIETTWIAYYSFTTGDYHFMSYCSHATIRRVRKAGFNVNTTHGFMAMRLRGFDTIQDLISIL